MYQCSAAMHHFFTLQFLNSTSALPVSSFLSFRSCFSFFSRWRSLALLLFLSLVKYHIDKLYVCFTDSTCNVYPVKCYYYYLRARWNGISIDLTTPDGSMRAHWNTLPLTPLHVTLFNPIIP